ncbi:HK97 gp10 family phage protein [Anaerotruncus sp. 1XD42-93]|uniref:HK97 gp10 family phage protein n=1 Tax=Anaerotruncus sp. 1XD42-93 TaxID=2320853 RepID=UPI000EA029F2|nr:HK97 gp10 family phage protein [Anaerotruncus sp. 1XD42-93]NBK18606.1 HK97 gp10 family phage protein [Anaerotruncus sp. 1XD42-93]RKJ79786.1 HK97 gp10 family phage protein [Anaerotruncus sp. 1XD22-93]
MKFGSCNLGGLKKLQEKLSKVQQPDMDAFLTACAKELAARLLRDVIRNTPVGDYSTEVKVVAKKDSKHHKKGETYTKRVNRSGKTGGTLRRGWTSQTKGEAAAGHGSGLSNVVEFLDKITVTHVGDTYRIELVNPVEYASYVEYGHRTPDHKGWVPGKFMLTIAEEHIRQIAPNLLAQRLKTFLEGYFT